MIEATGFVRERGSWITACALFRQMCIARRINVDR